MKQSLNFSLQATHFIALISMVLLSALCACEHKPPLPTATGKSAPPQAAESPVDSRRAGAGLIWRLIGPGDADQVTALSIADDGAVYLGTDIGGIYRTTNNGASWAAINRGLKNYDVTTPVVHHPTDPNQLYVGTRGGFYKSSDQGLSWHNKRSGLAPAESSSLSGSIGAIAIDPANPSTLYLGLGYRPGSLGTATVKQLQWSTKLYRSTDNGEHWTAISAFRVPAKVTQLVHADQGRIFAASSDGLYASSNGGRTWARLFQQETLGVLLFPNEPRRLLIAAGESGIFESTDAGISWVTRNNGLTFMRHASGPNRYAVLDRSSDGKTLYLVNSTWGQSGGLYSSNDGANSWQLMTEQLPESWLHTSRRMNSVVGSQINPNVVFLGSSRYVYRSTDRGNSWSQLISDRANNGWTHRGLNIFGHTRDVQIDPLDPNIIYIATSDHGLLKSVDAGFSWNRVGRQMLFGDSVLDLVACRESSVLYATSKSVAGKGCLSVSEDQGETWRPLCDGLNAKDEFRKVIIDHENCTPRFLATSQGLSLTKNEGRSWQTAQKLSVGGVHTLLIDPADRNTVYAGGKSGLFRSRDDGQTWRELTPKQGAPVTSIHLSANTAGLLLVGTERSQAGDGAIYRSNDSGRSWTLVLSGLRKHVSGIVQLPANSDIFYAATNDHNYHDYSQGSGIFRSIDGGITWSSINSGLPVQRAWNITVSPAYPNRVFLSSNGSGAYILDDPAGLVN